MNVGFVKYFHTFFSHFVIARIEIGYQNVQSAD